VAPRERLFCGRALALRGRAGESDRSDRLTPGGLERPSVVRRPSAEELEKIRKLRAEGLTMPVLAVRFDVFEGTTWHCLNRYNRANAAKPKPVRST
jgi:hypothetical protein